MLDLSDEEKKKVLGEVLSNRLNAIQEGIAGLPTRQEFTELRGDVDELKTDVKVIKAVVTDTSREVKKLNTRTAALEHAV